MVGVAGLQVLIIYVGRKAFKVSPYALTAEQWGICMAFGVGMVVWDWLVRFLPDKMFPQFGKKQLDPMQEGDGGILSLRKKRTESFSLRQGKTYSKEGSHRKPSFHWFQKIISLILLITIQHLKSDS